MDDIEVVIFCIVIPFVLVTELVIGCVFADERYNKEREKCIEKGGLVLDYFGGFQCLTKEEIEKLRGDYNENNNKQE